MLVRRTGVGLWWPGVNDVLVHEGIVVVELYGMYRDRKRWSEAKV